MDKTFPEVYNNMPPQPTEKKPGQLPESEIKKFFDEVRSHPLILSRARQLLAIASVLKASIHSELFSFCLISFHFEFLHTAS